MDCALEQACRVKSMAPITVTKKDMRSKRWLIVEPPRALVLVTVLLLALERPCAQSGRRRQINQESQDKSIRSLEIQQEPF